MLIRRKTFGCPDTRVGSVHTYVDTVAVFQEPGAAEAIFFAEYCELAIDTGIFEIDTGILEIDTDILLFEAVDLRFHD